MFNVSRPFLFFDYFRVPCRQAPLDDRRLASLAASHPLRACGQIWPEGNDEPSRALYWPPSDQGSAGALPPGRYTVESTPIFCQVIPDRVAKSWLSDAGTTWTPFLPVLDASGARVASIWRDERGSVFFPFDPAEAMQNCWSERYQSLGGVSAAARAKRVAMWSYYRVRPALPRPTQLMMRRLFTRVQARSRFPRWPVEPALHDLYELLFRLLSEVAGQPVYWLAEWPGGRSWALVLTHDVETAVGCEHLGLLRDVEREVGFRSSWNFVPRRYQVDQRLVDDLSAEGFEVGVHGLYHDGRDLESLPTLQSRLPAMRESAERWGATGFRSPATHRVWDWMPLLRFDYDSSYPDTDPYEPVSGGCCTWLPYFNEDLVELPITLPQDHTLFQILGRSDERTWVEKAEYLRSRGGMALVITHPDYMLEGPPRQAYARFLRHFQGDPDLWQALPRDVSHWWRRRAASHLEPMPDGYRIVGPAAADGRVRSTGSSPIATGEVR